MKMLLTHLPALVRASLAPSRKIWLLLLLLPGTLLTAHAQANYGADRGMFDAFVVAKVKSANDVIYDLNPQTSTANSDFDGLQLGNFSINESLIIRGGEVKTYKNSGCDVFDNTVLYYYVHPDGTTNQVPLRDFTRVALPFGADLGTLGDQRWGDANNPTNGLNIISGLTPGSYIIDVLMTADFAGCTSGASGTMFYSKSGANYQATFTVSAAPLPVTLTRFEASRQEANVRLSWETASEEDSRGYEVQVSTDSRTFRVLSFVPSQSEGSTSRRTYGYLDTEPGKTGLRYYRLRQLDLDGQETFYGPRVVNLGKAGFLAVLTAAPNPFTGELTLTLPPQVAPRTGTIVLTDILGRTALRQPLTLAAGVSQTRLPELDKLPKGLYYLRWRLDGEGQSVKPLKE
ncbi:MAG: T9SS type A sorting domain-containing protein [Hymenobacter sp.]|nr:T9SS type A sorting domain-containing protein [Hymenobacter sp.]